MKYIWINWILFLLLVVSQYSTSRWTFSRIPWCKKCIRHICMHSLLHAYNWSINIMWYCGVMHCETILFINNCNMPAVKWHHSAERGKMLTEMSYSMSDLHLLHLNIQQDISTDVIFFPRKWLAESLGLILKDVSTDISVCKFLCLWQCLVP